MLDDPKDEQSQPPEPPAPETTDEHPSYHTPTELDRVIESDERLRERRQHKLDE
jgi:hypothetical protein